MMSLVFDPRDEYNLIFFFQKREILRDSDVKEFQVNRGDLLVLSSDGLFDVVQDHVIERVVKSHDERVILNDVISILV